MVALQVFLSAVALSLIPGSFAALLLLPPRRLGDVRAATTFLGIVGIILLAGVGLGVIAFVRSMLQPVAT